MAETEGSEIILPGDESQIPHVLTASLWASCIKCLIYKHNN